MSESPWPTAADAEAVAYAQSIGARMVTCNRDDFLHLAGNGAHRGLIVLIRRRTRQSECAHLLALLDRAGDDGLEGNIAFA